MKDILGFQVVEVAAALWMSRTPEALIRQRKLKYLYNHRNTIVSSRDLQNVMNIGNELYTSLSRLSKQTYLLLMMDINHNAKEKCFTENIALTSEPLSFLC